MNVNKLAARLFRAISADFPGGSHEGELGAARLARAAGYDGEPDGLAATVATLLRPESEEQRRATLEAWRQLRPNGSGLRAAVTLFESFACR